MSCLSIFCITLKKGFNMVFPGDSDDKIQIELSAPQWELLSASRREMDESLARCVSVALKSGDMYQLYLSLDELDELLMFVEDQAEEENNKKKRQMWADLADYLDDVGEQESEGGFWGPGPIENLSEMTGSVYVFKVALADDASIWRRIALRGGQTLHDLHMAVFDAFDREEAHLYSFYIPPEPSKSRSVNTFRGFPEYTHPYALEESAAGGMIEMFNAFFGPFDPQTSIDAARTKLQSLELVPKLRLLYLFDFGDEWLHWITVEQTDGEPDNGDYPRILERKGESPPQYGDNDWEDDDDEDWDEDE